MNSLQNSNDQTGFPPAVALLLGAAAGLTAGILIAGKSGTRLRAEAGDALNGCWDSASGKVDEITRQGADLARKGAEQIQRVKTVAGDKLKQAFSSAVDSGETGAHKAIDDTVEAVHSAASKSHWAVSNAAGSIRSATPD